MCDNPTIRIYVIVLVQQQPFIDSSSGRCTRHIPWSFCAPSSGQDKGKVERCIQNLNREFVNHLRKFPEWLKGKLGEYRDWFNHSRYHRGVEAFQLTSTSVTLET